MFLYFPRKNIIIGNSKNLELYSIDEDNLCLANKWEREITGDDKFYLYYIDIDGIKYYLKWTGNRNILGVSSSKSDKRIEEDDKIYYINRNESTSFFVLNIEHGYLSEDRENFVLDIDNTICQLVEKL